MTIKNAWSANLAQSPGPLFCLGWLQDLSWILDLDCESRKTLRDFKAKLLFFTLMTQTQGVSRGCMASFGDFIMCLQFCSSLWMPIPEWVGRTRERNRSSTACAKAESRGTKVEGWAAAHTVSALHGATAPGPFPSASPAGCPIACPYRLKFLTWN